MYGAQTIYIILRIFCRFENDVEMYGAQTAQSEKMQCWLFENDVEMYGAQTHLEILHFAI